MNNHHSFLKFLLLLCLVTYVIAYSETEKRDVHRIILRSRRPRSHHHRGHSHKHSHHHHDYKKREKRGKYRHREPEYSYEDSSRYIDSRENSYESTERHKPHYRRKPVKLTKHRPYYTSGEYYEGENYKPKGEWTPLFSSETVSHFHPDPFEDFNPKRKRNKEKFKEPFRIEITTHYPETTQFYPFYNTEFPNYNNYKKTSDVEPLPLTRGFNDNDFRYKRNNTYEVHENHDDGGEYLKGGSFQALAPIIAVANTELQAEASHFNDIKIEKENFKREKKGNGRQRGRRMKMQNY